MGTLYSGEAPAMLGATSMGRRMSTLPSLLPKFLGVATCCLWCLRTLIQTAWTGYVAWRLFLVCISECTLLTRRGEELLCTEEDSKLRRVEERKSLVRRAGLVSNGPLSWHLTTCRASGYPMQQMRQLWAGSRGAKSQETQSWRSLQRGKCCHVASMSVMAWCMLCRLLQRRCGGTCFIPFPGICEHEGTELISVESILSL